MYHIVYDKQAVKDIKNLKSAGLDKKAKELTTFFDLGTNPRLDQRSSANHHTIDIIVFQTLIEHLYNNKNKKVHLDQKHHHFQ